MICCLVTQLSTLCHPKDCSCRASLILHHLLGLLRLISTESLLPSNHLILCNPFSSYTFFFYKRMTFLFHTEIQRQLWGQQSDGQVKFLKEEIHGKCHDGWLKRRSKEKLRQELLANKLKVLRHTRF